MRGEPELVHRLLLAEASHCPSSASQIAAEDRSREALLLRSDSYLRERRPCRAGDSAADRMLSSDPLNAVEPVVFKAVAGLSAIDISRLSRFASHFDMSISSMHFVRLKYLLEQELHIKGIATIDMLRYPERCLRPIELCTTSSSEVHSSSACLSTSPRIRRRLPGQGLDTG